MSSRRKKNPLTGGAPLDRKGRRILSRRVEVLAYVHAEIGGAYKHNFAAGVSAVEFFTGGQQCLLLYRPDGKDLIGDF